MKTRHTLIALAVGLACGGSAFAQTAATTDPSATADPTTTSATTTASGTPSTTTATSATASTTTPTSTTAARPANAAVQQKLVARFAPFAGSAANATALVTGLRTGGAISLAGAAPTATTASGTPASSSGATRFTSPTRPMGYGNIRIALSLAQAELASQGITQPTPQQIQTALMGSTTASGTQSAGILQQRASGMGWGRIAQAAGVNLGTVMSGRYVAAAPATATTPTTAIAASGGTTAAARGATTGSGIVSAAGGSASVATSYRHGFGAAASSGVVSAQGVGHGGGASGGGGGGSSGGHGRGKS